jgi:large subunit ribosomal protein L35
MPKMKSHKGLLKRVKITAKGKVKFRKSGTSHLNSVSTGNESRKLRGKFLAKRGDMKRLQGMLHRPLKPVDAK